MHKSAWKEVAAEKIGDGILRQTLAGANATVARFLLSRGAVIPRHVHANEQYSRVRAVLAARVVMVLSGSLRFVFDDREVVVNTGEVLVIPGNVPHSLVALEDTEDLDFFGRAARTGFATRKRIGGRTKRRPGPSKV
jgi:quercetin dioxygenase-like cupin family protein